MLQRRAPIPGMVTHPAAPLLSPVPLFRPRGQTSRPRALRARPLWRLRDEYLDRPRLNFLLVLRRLGASLAASLALLGEEPFERFLRLAFGVLFATAFLVEMFSVTGCAATTAFCNLRAAVVAMGFVARGSTDTPLGGRPRGLLAAGASLKEPAASPEAATWRFNRPAFGGPWLASKCFFAMASPLRISMPRQSSIPKRWLCSSALPLVGKKGSRLTSGERLD
ncbi:hypothetical protein MRX96_042121 [Rhipicephalus microplus]